MVSLVAEAGLGKRAWAPPESMPEAGRLGPHEDGIMQPPAIARNAGTVLVVDDDADMRLRFRTVLENRTAGA